MTKEALADRQAALHGDAGTDDSFQVDIPAKQPAYQVRSSRLFAHRVARKLTALLSRSSSNQHCMHSAFMAKVEQAWINFFSQVRP